MVKLVALWSFSGSIENDISLHEMSGGYPENEQDEGKGGRAGTDRSELSRLIFGECLP